MYLTNYLFIDLESLYKMLLSLSGRILNPVNTHTMFQLIPNINKTMYKVMKFEFNFKREEVIRGKTFQTYFFFQRKQFFGA